MVKYLPILQHVKLKPSKFILTFAKEKRMNEPEIWTFYYQYKLYVNALSSRLSGIFIVAAGFIPARKCANALGQAVIDKALRRNYN